MATITVPVRISDEATAYIAQLGMQRECELILEQAHLMQPDVQFFQVVLEEIADAYDHPKVIIEAHRPFFGPSEERELDRRWEQWWIETIHPNVWEHFWMSPVEEGNHGRSSVS